MDFESQYAVRTLGLTKKYGPRLVVDDLSLEVRRGDVFGFLGQNGAGKSTAMRMMLGLVRPTAGRILLLGHDVARERWRGLRRTGAMIESPAFYEHLSGRQNLRLLASLSGGVDRLRIDAVLEMVGLRERDRDPVRVYSHGMRQRLGIAQALLPAPELLILDEPTDGLDPAGIRAMRQLIERLRDELKLTILLSSHLLHEVEQICRRVAIIEGGRLLFQGDLHALVEAGMVVRLRVDRLDEAYRLLSADRAIAVTRDGAGFLSLKIPAEQVPHVNALLVERGFRVMEISPRRPTLEDVYLRLTRGVAPPRVTS